MNPYNIKIKNQRKQLWWRNKQHWRYEWGRGNKYGWWLSFSGH